MTQDPTLTIDVDLLTLGFAKVGDEVSFGDAGILKGRVIAVDSNKVTVLLDNATTELFLEVFK